MRSSSSAPPTLVPLAIIRSRQSLVARNSRRDGGVLEPSTKGKRSVAGAYSLEEAPLTAATARDAGLRLLLAAWNRLAHAVPHGADTLADVLHVVVSTVPAASGDIVEPLRLERSVPRPRATAAHPRAFKGTKRQPPKAARPTPLDLRRHLLAPASRRALLSALWPERAQASHALRKQGLEAYGLERLITSDDVPADPYLVYHHADAPRTAAPSRAFVKSLLPSLSGAPWAVVRSAARLYERLDLQDDDALAALVARLLHAEPSARTLAWIAHLEAWLQPRRTTFAALLLERDAWSLPADILPGVVGRPSVGPRRIRGSDGKGLKVLGSR